MYDFTIFFQNENEEGRKRPEGSFGGPRTAYFPEISQNYKAIIKVTSLDPYP